LNYIVVNEPTQTILNVITSGSQPKPDKDHSFHEVSITVLNHYYALFKKARLKGEKVSVSDLMNSCTTFHHQLSKAHLDKYR
jgi:hypothetical protein